MPSKWLAWKPTFDTFETAQEGENPIIQASDSTASAEETRIIGKSPSREVSKVSKVVPETSPEIMESLYSRRADATLRAMCEDYEPGTILWLEQNAPLLYESVTAELPDRISELWNAHGAACEFDAALAELLAAHRQAVALCRAAPKEADSLICSRCGNREQNLAAARYHYRKLCSKLGERNE